MDDNVPPFINDFSQFDGNNYVKECSMNEYFFIIRSGIELAFQQVKADIGELT